MATLTLNNGVIMPRLGLGTYKSDPKLLKQAIKDAIKCGYRHIDCAAVYGNEAIIGEALSEIFSSKLVKREDLFITSKLWNSEHRPERVLPALQKTLKDLQLTYLDLYLVHWPLALKPELAGTIHPSSPEDIDMVPVEDTWKAMEELVDKKLCRSIGVSNFTISYLHNLLCSARIIPAVNQVELHPFFQQKKLVDYCKRKNIVITCFCPLARPSIEKKEIPLYPSVSLTSSASSSSSLLSISTIDVNILTNPIILSLSTKLHRTPSQIVLRYSLQMNENICVIPKSVREERIKENSEIFGWKLEEEEMEEMKKLDVGYQLCSGERIYGIPFN